MRLTIVCKQSQFKLISLYYSNEAKPYQTIQTSSIRYIFSKQLSESRRNALSEELETTRVQCEASERNRRKADAETQDAINRISDLTSQVNTLTNERRRLDGELAVVMGDLEDLSGSKAVSI